MSEELRQQIERNLLPYSRIGLGEFGDGRFAERRDRKFPCHLDQISDIISGLHEDYDLIVPDKNSISLIESVYFDTTDFEFFNSHHRGKARRTKVRLRKYPDTKTSFLEIKRKSIKGLTLKQRVESKFSLREIDDLSAEFLYKNGIENSDKLKFALEINYRRYSFISKDLLERFSIDFDVRYNDGRSSGNFGDLAVVEVKQASYKTSPIIKRLREMRIREASLSKYCLSLSSLNSNLKSNRFKPTLRRLQEFFHEHTSTRTV